MTYPGPNGKRAVPRVPQRVHQRVNVDAVMVAALVADRAQPGVPTQIGPDMAIPLPDFAPVLAQIRAQMDAPDAPPPTPDDTDRLEIVEAVAAFQARVAAVMARIAARAPAPAAGPGIVLAKPGDVPPEPTRLRKVP